MAQADNEKELILGNKQLISLFFLVVAMCGAFFAFGYMIGHNAIRSAAASVAEAAPASASLGDTSPADSAPAADETGPASPDSQPTVTETQPAKDTPNATPGATPGAAPNATAGATQAFSPAPAQTAQEPAPASQTDANATYLQVTALHRVDADNLVKTLKEQNLPALLAESSKPDLFRVLVGPYRQMSQVADAKARLKALGFANAFVQK